MSTEVTTYDTDALAVPAAELPALPGAGSPFGSVTSDAIARLGEWVKAASQAHQLVAPLIDSVFVPEAYKPRVAANASDEERTHARSVAISNAVSAVLLGLNLGVDPMTALQQIYVVKGRPGMYSKMKVALLQSRGYQIWTETLTDEQATVVGVRPGSDQSEKVTITIEMAKKAGWLSNEAYQKTPQDMLWARAAGRVCDRIGAEVLMGIPTVEDIPDTVQVEATVGPRITAADIIAATVDQPAMTGPADEAWVPVEPERVEPKPSDAALKRMFAMMGKHGLGGKDRRELALGWISDTIGREITSREELTAAEVRRVCDTLEALETGDAQPHDPGEAQS